MKYETGRKFYQADSIKIFISRLCLYFSVAAVRLQSEKEMDTRTSGTIHISSDESFKPVVDSQVKVFEALSRMHIIVHYKPEADCFRDLTS